MTIAEAGQAHRKVVRGLTQRALLCDNTEQILANVARFSQRGLCVARSSLNAGVAFLPAAPSSRQTKESLLMPPLPGTVVTAGSDTPLYLGPLLLRLGEKGLHHRNAASTEDLIAMLREGAKLDRLAVLVYNGPGTDTAHCWLEALEPDYSNVPVIVVVNEPNVEEHYELMSQGAYDYFGFSEGTTVIEEAVRWAAQTDAVSARAAARRSENFTPDGPATNLLKG
jgi:hypothetical protein